MRALPFNFRSFAGAAGVAPELTDLPGNASIQPGRADSFAAPGSLQHRPPGNPLQGRQTYVDWLRAVGIGLVVYGHSQGVPSPLYRCIYAFHMPLFFFISGLTLKLNKEPNGFRGFAWSAARSLIPPYLFFAAIGYVIWLLVGRHYSSHAALQTPILRPLWAIAYGSGSQDDLLQPMVLWFFPCLFTTQLLFWFVARGSMAVKVALIAASAVLGILVRNCILPWEIDSALLALPFIWFGYETGRLKDDKRRHWSSAPVTLTLAAIAAIALSQLNSGVDLRKSQVGNPVLFFATATLMIHALQGFARFLPFSPAMEKISRSTIVIFPLHPHAFWALAAFYALVLGRPALRQNPWVAPCASLVVVILLTVAASPIQKLLDGFRERMFPRHKLRSPQPG